MTSRNTSGPCSSQKVVDRHQVAQALRHLLALELQHAVVDPVAGKRLSGEALGLGDLVLMVRKDQVVAAAVDVDLVAQVQQVHRRAFDVPARPALAPRAVPTRLARLGRLPQGEIAFVLFLLAARHTRAGDGLIQPPSGELAIVGIGPHAEIDIAAGRDVGVLFLQQAGHHLDDLRDGLRDAREDRWPQHVQLLQLRLVLLGIAAGDHGRIFAGLVSRG